MYVQIGAKIKKAREEKFLSQAELGARLGLTATAINYYEKGKRKVTIEDLYRLAAALDKPLNYFLPRERTLTGEHGHPSGGRMEVFNHMVDIPIAGEIRAGEAAPAAQCNSGFLPFPGEMARQEHFALRVTGDSMAGAGIYEGDLVLLRRQFQADYNGQIVCALVNGEDTTLKIFQREKEGSIRLRAANPNYPDLVLKDDKNLKIQGVFAGVFKFPQSDRTNLPPED